jgi:hypothetical protein
MQSIINNNHNTQPVQIFTISQAFLGAPLQFTPALGSHELEQLVDAYVLGNGSKAEKLSEVTIDFYNNATVDLNNGALVKTYHVFPLWDAFEQSPTESQSSGFSKCSLLDRIIHKSFANLLYPRLPHPPLYISALDA